MLATAENTVMIENALRYYCTATARPMIVPPRKRFASQAFGPPGLSWVTGQGCFVRRVWLSSAFSSMAAERLENLWRFP
jgi:hypothetical protein